MAQAAKPKTKTKAADASAQGTEPRVEEGHVCTVSFCPICLAVTAGQSIRPDAVEHLLAAGRELMLAVSAVLGARATGAEEPERTATLTRIDIE